MTLTLQDQVIDEAEKLAHEVNCWLPTDEIVRDVSQRVRCPLANSNLARLAEAAYNRIWFAESQVRGVFLGR
jgi:hypothetical protein